MQLRYPKPEQSIMLRFLFVAAVSLVHPLTAVAQEKAFIRRSCRRGVGWLGGTG